MVHGGSQGESDRTLEEMSSCLTLLSEIKSVSFKSTHGIKCHTPVTSGTPVSHPGRPCRCDLEHLHTTGGHRYTLASRATLGVIRHTPCSSVHPRIPDTRYIRAADKEADHRGMRTCSGVTQPHPVWEYFITRLCLHQWATDRSHKRSHKCVPLSQYIPYTLLEVTQLYINYYPATHSRAIVRRNTFRVVIGSCLTLSQLAFQLTRLSIVKVNAGGVWTLDTLMLLRV